MPPMAATSMLALMLSSSAAQDRDLFADLEGLNVRHTTAHYALAGTVGDAKLREYGEALELAYREYANGFGALIDSKKPGRDGQPAQRFRVVIFAKPAEYEEFARAYFPEGREHSTGLFVAAARLLVIRDSHDRHRTYGTLFHEAFHQFARRHIPTIPIWLNEGLATYYGTARPVRGKLAFHRRESNYFRLIKDAARQGQLIPWRELMASSQAEFYEESAVHGLGVGRKSLCYAQSYTLTSYMINDNAGREFLRKYMRALAEAKTSEDAHGVTREMFTDKLLEGMTKPWLAHIGL